MAAPRRPRIDLRPESVEELRRVLDLVQDDGWTQFLDEEPWIGTHASEGVRVLEQARDRAHLRVLRWQFRNLRERGASPDARCGR
ncbi:MAG: hypothetical protein U0838_18105 [Chloroflexota bacterium]